MAQIVALLSHGTYQGQLHPAPLTSASLKLTSWHVDIRTKSSAACSKGREEQSVAGSTSGQSCVCDAQNLQWLVTVRKIHYSGLYTACCEVVG
jgi:hypothetical protein